MSRPIKFIPPLQVTNDQPITVVQQGLNSPRVRNYLTSATPNTETTIVLADPTRFTIINRGNVVVKMAYAVGESGTIYLEIIPNAPYSEDGLSGATIPIYVQAPHPSQRLEIITWA